MTPYYEQDGITIYHGDCREFLPALTGEVVITDPVWPDAEMAWGRLAGADDPYGLLRTASSLFPASIVRLAVQLGCDSHPRILGVLPGMSFFRVVTLDVAKPGYKGRLLMTGDIAYLFGAPPTSRPGRHLIPGRTMDSFAKGRECDHPCPRKMSHLEWLVSWWSEPAETVLDPFCGGGTTLLAAKNQGRKAVGIEIEERYCEIAAKRLSQGVLQLSECN